jgi:tripartite-type tricarboxylate transporter receptor subunit TctC
MVSRGFACGAALLCLLAAPARAQSVEDFYRGKTIDLYIGFTVGGGYDLYARLMGRFLGDHVPGKPRVVPKQMTGAGSRILIKYMLSVAPKDGAALATADQSMALEQVIGDAAAQYDASQFHWIGNPAADNNTTATWHTTGVRTVEDARRKELSIGATGANTSAQYPAVLNMVAGTKFKIILGYPGGADINLAMERGEVHGRNNTWSSWKATKPAWLASGDLRVVAYEGPPQADLPGVPTLQQLVKTEDDRAIVRLVAAGAQLGRPLATGPDVPADRVSALRAAFDAMVKDADFLKEAAALNFDVAPVRGEAMQKIVADVLATPKPLRERARPIIE